MRVANDFDYDDDSVIERLRDNMHDLRSKIWRTSCRSDFWLFLAFFGSFFLHFCTNFQVAKDFDYDDDSVIERLRENMHDLRSLETI